MHWTPDKILELANGMATKPNGFRVSLRTGELVVETLRLYAREQGVQGWRSTYQVDGWDKAGIGIFERLAETGNWEVAQAAYQAALAARPGHLITLRQGTRVVKTSDRGP